jgi:opacity protein-like surface antigen
MGKLVFALLASAAAFSAAAQAQTQNAQNFRPRAYVGVGGAVVDHDYSISGLRNIDSEGATISGRVFGGYEFDPIWAVEAGYDDFSQSDFRFNLDGFRGRGRSDGYGVYVAGKGRLPLQAMVNINQPIEAFGKLGVAYSHRKTESTRDSPTFFRFDDDDTGLYAGVGVQWNFHPQWSLTAEYERYGRSKTNGAQADVFSFGARYNF